MELKKDDLYAAIHVDDRARDMVLREARWLILRRSTQELRKIHRLFLELKQQGAGVDISCMWETKEKAFLVLFSEGRRLCRVKRGHVNLLKLDPVLQDVFDRLPRNIDEDIHVQPAWYKFRRNVTLREMTHVDLEVAIKAVLQRGIREGGSGSKIRENFESSMKSAIENALLTRI